MIYDRSELRSIKPYKNIESGLIMGISLSLFGLFLGGQISDKMGIYPQSFFEHAKIFLMHNQTYLDWLANQQFKKLASFYFLPFFLSTTLGWFGWAFFAREFEPLIHLRGRRLLEGKTALKAAKLASKNMLQKSPEYCEILDGIPISSDQLLKSVLVCGSQGGGKTVFINQFLLKLIEKKTKLVVFDSVKGDYSRWLPFFGADLIISSTDSRSWHWYLGLDLTDEADAAAFSRGFIAQSSDPMWSNSARLVLTGCIVILQKTRGQDWSWPELSDLLLTIFFDDSDPTQKDPKDCLSSGEKLMSEFYPPSTAFIAPGSKTSQSIEMNMKAYTSSIWTIAKTWANIQNKKFSLKKWLDNDNTKHRHLLIQMNQRDATTGASLSRAIVEYSTNHISSLDFGESKTRKLCFVLDEVPQLGKLESLIKLNEIGRSKGCFVIVGFQDSSQIATVYGKEEVQKWAALFGIRVFPQVVGADSQQWVAKQIGDREVQFRQKSVSGQGVGAGVNVSTSLSQPQIIPVILPSELELFGKVEGGINALFLGLGKDALALKIAFPTVKDLRKAHVPWSPLPNLNFEDETKKTQETEGGTSIIFPSEPVLQAPEIDEPINNNINEIQGEVETEILETLDSEPVSEESDAPKLSEEHPINGHHKPQNDDESSGQKVEEEAAGEIATNTIDHAVSEVLGIDAGALEILNIFDEFNLNNAESEDFQVSEINQNSSKRKRKKRSYVSEH